MRTSSFTRVPQLPPERNPRRVGLVGFGSIAEHGHLNALRRFPDVEIAAIADVSSDRLERAGDAAPEAMLFDSPEALIREADIDILDICTPPHTHADLIDAAATCGVRSIACEKPFVLTEAEFNRVAQVRTETGARIASVNNWRSSHLNQRVSEVLDEGVLGDVTEVRLLTARPDAARGSAGWLPSWRTNAAYAGGGIVLDHGWHQFYLVFGWMRDRLDAVEATVRTLDPRHAPVEDDAHIDLLFERGGRARIDLSWTSPERRNEGAIRCERGEIEIADDRLMMRGPEGIREIRFGDRLTVSSYHPEWFHEFFRCTILDADSEESDRNFAEAGLLVRTVGAVYRSGRQGGARVSLTDPASAAEGEKVGSERGHSGLSGPSTEHRPR